MFIQPVTRLIYVLTPSDLFLHHLETRLLLSTGLGFGGLWGLREGAARPLAVSNARLRLNSILNGVTRRGTFLGNSAGVLGRLFSVLVVPHCAYSAHMIPFVPPFPLYLTTFFVALIYNIVNSSIDSWRGRHDVWGGMAAGGLCGAVYKSTGNAPSHMIL